MPQTSKILLKLEIWCVTDRKLILRLWTGLIVYRKFLSLYSIWKTRDFRCKAPPVIERIFIFFSKLKLSICCTGFRQMYGTILKYTNEAASLFGGWTLRSYLDASVDSSENDFPKMVRSVIQQKLNYLLWLKLTSWLRKSHQNFQKTLRTRIVSQILGKVNPLPGFLASKQFSSFGRFQL